MKVASTDVAVIGGGSAGFCAAVAAARAGVRVVLIERSDTLGGMGTLAKVHTFCGLYQPDVSRPPRIANPGLPAEIENLMRSRTGAGPVSMGKVYVLPQDPAAFAEIAHQLAMAETSLEIRFSTTCIAIDRQPGKSFAVTTDSGTIDCRAIVDASADAVVAEFLGLARRSVAPEQTQRSAFIFSLQGVAPAAMEESFRMRLALEIVRAVAAGSLPRLALATAGRPSTTPGEIHFTTDLDPAPPAELIATGLGFANAFTDFLRTRFPEYATASAPLPARLPGIRETYRWIGQYTLTAEDLTSCREFPDTAAYATWPIELRETTRGPKLRFFDRPLPAAIPLRALTGAGIDGVFCAGRCISATHDALASVRVIGTCFATGQAAGRAAAAHTRKP